MTAAQILATPATKTWKMQQLFALGLSRREVATMMNVGYGFAQNFYARCIATTALATPTCPATIAALALFALGAFTRTFGVEIEANGVTRDALVAELRAQGLEVHAKGYNHTTRPH